MFEENNGVAVNGANTTTPLSLLTSDDGAANPYLSTLQITSDYRVEIQLSGAANTLTRGATSYTSPVAKSLLGTKIVLIPIKGASDEKISGWKCLTDADANVQEFMGYKNLATLYKASIIR